MPDQHAEVHVGAAPAQHRHVFGKGLEPPVDAGAQRIEIHSLPTARLRMIRSRRCEGEGTIPKPQFPITAVVMPIEGDGDSVGSQVTCAS
jgi:hypothetical protein